MIDQQRTNVYEFSGYRIDEHERLLKRNGDVISLPPKAIDLLLVLLGSGGRVLTKDEVMQRVWADTFVEETNLTHNVSLLRRVLGEKQNGTKFIETIPRRGYRFVADVKIADDDDFELIELERTNTRVLIEKETDVAVEEKGTPSLKMSGRRFLVFAAPVLGIALLAGLGFWYLTPRGVDAPTLQFAAARRITSDGTAKMATISPDGKFVAYVTDKDRRHTLWVQNVSTGSAVPILSDKPPITSVRFGPSDRVYFVMADALYHIPMLGGPLQKIADVATGSATQSFTLSPDGNQVAFMRADQDTNISPIFVAHPDGGNERLLAASTSPNRILRSPDWSPDGQLIAAVLLTETASQTIGIISVSDGSISVIPTPKWGHIEQVEWFPDGQALLALIEGGEVWKTGFPDGTSTKLSDNVNDYSSISLSADGKTLVLAKQESDGHIWHLTLDEETKASQLTSGFDKSDGGAGLDWLTNDRIRFEATGTGESWGIDVSGANASKIVRALSGMSSVSPDKKTIIGQSADENGRSGLYRIEISNGERTLLAPVTAVFPRFSPDGKWVVFTHYTDDVAIWKIPSQGGEPVKLTNLPGFTLNPVVSPDGTRIAFVWWESQSTEAPAKIAVVSSSDGSLLTAVTIPLQWEGEAGRYSKETLEWTPDGKAIDFIQMRNGVSNIWRQSLDGGEPTQITFFETGRIANFAFSPDRKQLALSRGNFASDIFLISSGD